MHFKLANALNYLDIGTIAIRNENNELVRKIEPKEHATALFTYLHLAGYLSPEILQKAVQYLSAAKPFPCSNEELIKHFNTVYSTACQGNGFNADYFFDNFSNTPHIEVDDVIDLIVFLQQTAFDRNFGKERDNLQTKPWLEQYPEKFVALATNLGIVTPLPPKHPEYCGTGIMGAAYVRLKPRITYFGTLAKTKCGEVSAITGERELSKGLDDGIMEEVAKAVGKPINYVERGPEGAKRIYLDGVTETMMVNYMLMKMQPSKHIEVVDSATEEGHWRATTTQGAKDIALKVVLKIKNKELQSDKDGIYRYMIIADQPYPGRMTRQVQRAFDAELKSQGLGSVKLIVEGVGPCIQASELTDIGVLTRMNSELGSLMAERYYDARLRLMENTQTHTLRPNLRDPGILMYQTRDKAYIALQEAKSEPENVVNALV